MSGRDGEEPAGTRSRSAEGSARSSRYRPIGECPGGDVLRRNRLDRGAEEGLAPVAQYALRFATRTSDAAGTVSAAALSLANGVSRSMMLTKLKWVAATVMAMALAGSGRVGSPHGHRWGPDSCGTPSRWRCRAEARPIQDADPAAKRSERAITQEQSLPPFEAIRVSGDIRVVVTRGKDRRVTAVGDSELLRALRLRVEKTNPSQRDCLIVAASIAERDRGDTKAGDGVEVQITIPLLSEAIAEGDARVEIQKLQEKSVDLKVSDMAKMTLSGSSHIIRARIEKSGELDASRLDVGTANVAASDRSWSFFHVSRTLSVISSGDARVEYTRVHRSTQPGDHRKFTAHSPTQPTLPDPEKAVTPEGCHPLDLGQALDSRKTSIARLQPHGRLDDRGRTRSNPEDAIMNDNAGSLCNAKQEALRLIPTLAAIVTLASFSIGPPRTNGGPIEERPSASMPSGARSRACDGSSASPVSRLRSSAMIGSCSNAPPDLPTSRPGCR